MKAAVVQGPGQAPVYRDFEEPTLASDENRITVTAAAVSQNVKSRASGQHYSCRTNFPLSLE